MSDDDDKVGYRKPPKAHRWPPGKSGNPGGSSRKVRDRKRKTAPVRFADLVLKEALRPIKIREGNRVVTITAQQAAIRALQLEGLKGNRLALQSYLKTLKEAQQDKVDEVVGLFEAALNYKERYQEVARQRKARGLPPPLPHPDDIVLDRERGEVIITGPMCEEEMPRLTNWLKGRQVVLDAIEVQRQNVEDCAREGMPPDPNDQKMIEKFEVMLQELDEKVGRGWKPRVAGAVAEPKKTEDKEPQS